MDVKVYTSADSYLAKRHEHELRHIRERENEINNQFTNFRQQLTSATESFVKGGVAYVGKDLNRLFDWLPERKAKAYFKELAKELDRPFIFAEEFHNQMYVYGKGWQYSAGVELTIPAIDRLKNAVAGLSLIAVPDTRENEEAPVKSNHSERVWRFRFTGETGLEHFKNFCDFCRTNPIMRVTLKLPRE